MNICEFIQEKIAAGEFDDNVSAHLRICHECKEFADELDRFLSCDLPDAGAPSHDVETAIRAYAAEAAEANRLLSCELPEVGGPSAAVDEAIRVYAAETAEANRLLSCELPEVGEPPAAVDSAIRAYAAKASAKAAQRKSGLAKAFRIWIPAAAALAVCFLFYFDPMGKQQEPLAMPTHATVAGDWTGAVMDGEFAQVSLELTNSMENLSLSDTDLLIAQLEADFAAYMEN